MYQIKEVADLLGISVRILHHYDKIGLVKPDDATKAGYRLYSDENLLTLQQVLFFKELDFTLKEIKGIISHQNFDKVKALKTHKEILQEKAKRLEKIISTVDKTILSLEGGMTMDKNEMFSAFDMSKIKEHEKKYQEEVKEKYGTSDAYKESQKKTKNYTKDDWEVIKKEGSEIYRKLASLMQHEPGEKKVQEAINEHRSHITKYFYQCTLDIYKGLGELYVSDIRFTKNIDKYQTGLAQFLKEAIDVYCHNHEGI